MDINSNIRPITAEQSGGLVLQQRHVPASVNEDRTDLAIQMQQIKTDAVTGAPAQKDKKVREDLDQVVQQMNKYVQNIQRDLQFSVDGDSGMSVVKVIDSKSKEVIRQIPNEEVLIMARQLAEQQNEEGTRFNLLKTSA